MQASHRNNFDFLRFAAAVMVWYSHCYGLTRFPDPLSRYVPFESFGSLGVTIFFVISGYFVTASYENNGNFLIFIRNRALRIIPALWVVVLLSVFVLGPAVTTDSLHQYFADSETWKYLRSMMIFPLQYNLPGVFHSNEAYEVNGSLWTLKQEVRLYGVIAILGVLGILQPRLMFVLLAGLCSLRIYGIIKVPLSTDRIFTQPWADLELAVRLATQFAVGACLYLGRETVPLKISYFFISIVIIVASIYMPYSPKIGNLLFDLAFGYALVCIGFLRIPLLHAFNRWGDFSYGFYLYAFPMQQLFLQILGGNANFTAFLLASFCATFLCSVLSWHAVEKPALSLKG